MAKRIHIRVRGAVQGVGFRPFVYRLAVDLGLTGWVKNDSDGVVIEAEAEEDQLRRFLLSLSKDKPAHAFIQSMEHSYLDQQGYTAFEILESSPGKNPRTLILPDIALCPDCLEDILDPSNRRHGYPFTNCTNCGPRYSIIESLPYDRDRTTMKRFTMCEECRREYLDPLNRRFHAQPIACPRCGPRLELWDADGRTVSTDHDALHEAARHIREGKIAAVKGLGGFQLMVLASDTNAVLNLRRRKHREEKPFALMANSLTVARSLCAISPFEERLLLSPEAPIVLLRSRGTGASVSPAVAPGNPYLGLMLPYTPLHHLLLQEVGSPVVATSGNLTDEPICIDEREALLRLRGIADVFLVHDRPIARQVDDSVTRVVLDREMILRRARGYAPLPIPLRNPVRESLAVGAHLKNSVAYARGNDVFVSQHIGDLETEESYAAFRRTIDSLGAAYDMHPEVVAADMHPDYLSTVYAKSLSSEVVSVQHHHAHIVSCMAENQIDGRVLGVSWDGTGYGPDGTIWGGEFLIADHSTFHRAASLKPFMLPGGELAVREPRRSMVGLFYEIWGDALFGPEHSSLVSSFTTSELQVVKTMLQRKFHAPVTTSAGRLFDGVASLIGLRQRSMFEGQAAMELEFATDGPASGESYPYDVRPQNPVLPFDPDYIVDWVPMILAILDDLHAGMPRGRMSAQFHNTLAEMIVDVAVRTGESAVVLSGGCFQNVYLLQRTVMRLTSEGFNVSWHQRVPPNDGGIALGQIVAATSCQQPYQLISSTEKENNL